MTSNTAGHLLLYEPRTEGHHLGWLRFLVDDLLSGGFRLSIAADLRPGGRELVQEHLAGLPSTINLFSAYDEKGNDHFKNRVRSVAHCLKFSGADRVFLCALDEIASECWRNATFGFCPPPGLRGRMGGIYHRPRFLAGDTGLIDRALKQPGFKQLLREDWFGQILFVDEFLVAGLQKQFPKAPLHFLPDPCPPGYEGDSASACDRLGIPAGRKVFLFYGTGARRKGLHLAVNAMLQLPPESPAFLLCAGRQNPKGETAAGLDQLIRQNRARLLDRYVTVEEEKLCLAAADCVLLPYLNHFGTSGVLSRAMAAAKPVIASDEQLLGHLAREHQLGLVFPSGNVAALAQAMTTVTALSGADTARLTAAARRYREKYSRAAFRDALLHSLD